MVIWTPASSLHSPCIFSINAMTYSVLPLASHTCVRRKWEIFNTANEFSTKWRGTEFPSGLNSSKGSGHCAVVISHLSFWIILFENMGSSVTSSFSTIKWISCGKKTKLKKEENKDTGLRPRVSACRPYCWLYSAKYLSYLHYFSTALSRVFLEISHHRADVCKAASLWKTLPFLWSNEDCKGIPAPRPIFSPLPTPTVLQ